MDIFLPFLFVLPKLFRMKRAKTFAILFLILFMIVFSVYLCRKGLKFHHIELLWNKYKRSKNPCRESRVPVEHLRDFHNYPCLDYKSVGISKELPGVCVRTVCKEEVGLYDAFSNRCVPVKNIKNNVCTYDPKLDLVSRFIHEKGEWEPALVESMKQTLQKYPELVFLDLGCNIGVYTIAAASMETKTFCVDANPENLRLVSRSVSFGGLGNFVTLIWNALSDQSGEVHFKVVKGNAGASRIGDTDKYNMTIVKNIAVNAIMLDDLLWLFSGKQVFMKIDLESYELNVLKGAFEFFKHVDVRFLQMELVEEETFQAVVDLLYSWGYLMFRDPSGKERLDRKDFVPGPWPGDVYFIKLTHLHGQ